MVRWLPFGMVSLVWLGLIWRAGRRQAYWRVAWWLGCWGLSALTWTPTALNIGNANLTGITTHWWWGGIWVLRPLQPASVDWSFWLNILMTVPQGMLLAGNWPHLRMRQWCLVGLAVGLTLEGGQALGNALVGLGRWVDINDVLTNLSGVVLGAWLWRTGRQSTSRL